MAEQEIQDVIRVKRIEVVDDEGNPRVEIGEHWGVVWGLNLVSSAGKSFGHLGIACDRMASLEFDDGEASVAVSVGTVDPEQCGKRRPLVYAVTDEGSGCTVPEMFDTVNEVSSPPLNPSWEECRCSFGKVNWESEFQEQYGTRGRKLHDLLLSLDGPNPIQTVTEIVYMMFDADTWPFDPGIGFLIAEHNWRDPVAMREFGSILNYCWEDLVQRPNEACRRQELLAAAAT